MRYYGYARQYFVRFEISFCLDWTNYMKLNMSMIEAYLKRCETESNIQSNARTIRGMRFLTEADSDYSRDYIYVSLARDYFEDPRYADALILASGRNHIVCKGLEYAELVNDVLSAFDFYNGAERRLARLAAQHSPISDMTEVIGRLIDAPFLVFGIDGAYLGGSHVDELQDEALLRNIRETGSLGAGIIGASFSDGSGAVHIDLSTKPKMTRGPEGQMAINMYLSEGREAVGFIMCFPQQPQHTRLSFALEPLLADFLISAREFTDGRSAHQALHLTLANLLHGRSVSDEAKARIEQSLGPIQRLSVVLVRSLQVSNRTQRILLAQEISSLAPYCIAAEIGEAVAFVVPERQVDGLLAQVLDRFAPKNAAVGVSMPVVGLERAPIAMRQAEFACGASSEAGVRYCKDLALPFLLRALREEPTMKDMLHPAISIIAHYDDNHNAHLMDTLKAFLDARYNQVEAAKRLHVHLNTFKYRLKRIEEISDLDFTSKNDMLYLQLSFELQSE